MKRNLAVLLCSLAVAAPAFGGEDSTDRWGEGGTGPMVWESPCELSGFQADLPLPVQCRPARSRSGA